MLHFFRNAGEWVQYAIENNTSMKLVESIGLKRNDTLLKIFSSEKNGEANTNMPCFKGNGMRIK